MGIGLGIGSGLGLGVAQPRARARAQEQLVHGGLGHPREAAVELVRHELARRAAARAEAFACPKARPNGVRSRTRPDWSLGALC